jgi:hypothetical protein
MAAGQDEYIDGCALGFCVLYESHEEKLACVAATRGRVYSNEDLEECAKHQREDATTCLAARGKNQGRLSQLEFAKDKGARLGEAAGTKDKRTFDLKAATSRGQASGDKVALDALKVKAFNLGVRNDRDSPQPLDPVAFKEGETAGAEFATKRAKEFDWKAGFNQAFATADSSSQPPLNSQTVNLSTAAMPPSLGSTAPALPQIQKITGESSPPEPAASEPKPIPQSPPEDKDPYRSDLPTVYTSGLSVPNSDSPCVPEDDKACLDAFESGFQDGFVSGVHRTFTEKYQEAYLAAFRPALEQALKQDLPLASKAEGTRFSSHERGFLEAFKKAYPGQKNALTIEGEAAFAAALQKHSFVRLVDVKFRSAGGDYVIPGNVFFVDITVDNHGALEVPAGYYRFSLAQSRPWRRPGEPLPAASSWKVSTRVLPSIPGRTRTVFQVALEGTGAQVKTGQALEIRTALELHTEKWPKYFLYQPVQEKTLPLLAHYPLELASVEPRSPFSGLQEVTALFSIKNSRADRSAPYVATLTTEPNTVKVRDNEKISIPALAPGEVFHLETKLTPTLWVNYQSPTDFSLMLADDQGAFVSRQNFPLAVDLGMPVGLKLVHKGADVSNRVIHHSLSSGNLSIQLRVECTEEIRLSDGYRFRYLGPSRSEFSFLGTTSASVGPCKPGNHHFATSGSIRVPEHHVDSPGAIRFQLEKDGVAVQKVQVFVQTMKGTESGKNACGACR